MNEKKNNFKANILFLNSCVHETEQLIEKYERNVQLYAFYVAYALAHHYKPLNSIYFIYSVLMLSSSQHLYSLFRYKSWNYAPA